MVQYLRRPRDRSLADDDRSPPCARCDHSPPLRRSGLAGAVSVGVLTHLLGDSYGALLSGRIGRAAFLLWSFFPAPTYPADSFLYHLSRWESQLHHLSSLSPADFLASGFSFQLVLAAVLFGVWTLDGFAEVRALWRLVTRGRTPDRRPE